MSTPPSPTRLGSSAPDTQGEPSRSGFSMVELVIALIVLAVGLLGMAGTTAYVVRQTTLAEVTSERAVALQTVLERLRAMDYDSVDSSSDSVGMYALEWTVTESSRTKQVTVVTTGPGLASSGSGIPSMSYSVPDTFTYTVVRP